VPYRLRILAAGANAAAMCGLNCRESQEMEQIVWLPQMSVGIPAMDAAHKDLLEEMVRLAHETDADFGAGLCALTARLERDFQAEEELMESIDFSGLPSHREQHARALSGLHHVASRVMSGDIASGREAIDLLPQWFLIHLSTMDTTLVVALAAAKEGLQQRACANPGFARSDKLW
jgi:hemerythrin